jgi:hypothetical protein
MENKNAKINFFLYKSNFRPVGFAGGVFSLTKFQIKTLV